MITIGQLILFPNLVQKSILIIFEKKVEKKVLGTLPILAFKIRNRPILSFFYIKTVLQTMITIGDFSCFNFFQFFEEREGG